MNGNSHRFFYEKVHFIQYIIPLTGKQINLDKLHCGNLQMKYINTFSSAVESKNFTKRHLTFPLFLIKGMDSEPHKTPYVYVKYLHKFISGTRECISGLLRKIFVFKVGKPSFFPASE